MHAKVFPIQMFQYLSQIQPRVCTLVLFMLNRYFVVFVLVFCLYDLLCCRLSWRWVGGYRPQPVSWPASFLVSGDTPPVSDLEMCTPSASSLILFHSLPSHLPLPSFPYHSLSLSLSLALSLSLSLQLLLPPLHMVRGVEWWMGMW